MDSTSSAADDENSTSSSGELPQSDLTPPMSDSIVTLMVEREKRGRCADCGMDLREITAGGKVGKPLTIEGTVLLGRCLICKPLPEGFRQDGKRVVRDDPTPQRSVTSRRYQRKKIVSSGAGVENSTSRKKRPRMDVDIQEETAQKEEPEDDDVEHMLTTPRKKRNPNEQTPSPKKSKIQYPDLSKAPTWFQAAMKRYLNNQDDFSACENLSKMIRKKASKKYASYIVNDTEAVSIIINSMKEFPKKTEIQTEACWALTQLAWLHEPNAQEITSSRYGAIPQIKDIMKCATWNSKQRKIVTEPALEALRYLSGSTSSRIEIVKGDGIDCVLEAMELFGEESEKVVEESFALLQNLSYREQPNSESFHDVSVRIMMPTKYYVRTILNCVRYHPKHVNIQEFGCCAIHNLTLGKYNVECRKAFFDEGVFEVIKTTTVEHSRVLSVVQPVVKTFLNYLGVTNEDNIHNEQTSELYLNGILEMDAIKIVLKLMKKHTDTDSEEIQHDSSEVLYRIIEHQARHVKSITACGGFPIILDAMRMYPTVATIQENACFLFKQGVQPTCDGGGDENKDNELLYKEMGKRVLEALRNHQDDRELQEEALGVLSKYSSKSSVLSILIEDEQTMELLKRAEEEYPEECSEPVHRLMDAMGIGDF